MRQQPALRASGAHGESPGAAPSADFGDLVRRARRAGVLVVQPRMGFSRPVQMRAGLQATKSAAATSVGTITLDSYTRVGELHRVEDALRSDIDLNGYPIVNHPAAATRWMLSGIQDPDFPVQVRHGSANPARIFAALRRTQLSATEGGPVSYCLPYGRTPLRESVKNWEICAELFSGSRQAGVEPHMETFGGCMMGQLCPPSQLVAISFLEALFFHRHGLRSISVSYAQQTHPEQDREAVLALRKLCADTFTDVDWHVVVYAYMGVYPESARGAYRLLAQAAQLAVATHSERLIVKTVAESRRIPTIAENVAALDYAAGVARAAQAAGIAPPVSGDSQIYAEAYALIDTVLNLHEDIGKGLLLAFERGYLDIPYCLHPDNRGRSRSHIDADGRLGWSDIGSLPLGKIVRTGRSPPMTSQELLATLSYVRVRLDNAAPEMEAIARSGPHGARRLGPADTY